MYKYTSNDGLVKSNYLEGINLWNKIVEERQKKEKEFIKELKQKNIKALHPDDGWVDRVNNTISFCYPKFFETLKVGDVVALGDFEHYRLVRIIQIIPNHIFCGDSQYDKNIFEFEEIKWRNEK